MRKNLILVCAGIILICLMTGCGAKMDKVKKIPEAEDVSYEICESDHAEKIWENIAISQFQSIPEVTGEIVSFDVNDAGEIAVAYENGKICVYSNDFEYQNGFRFSVTGLYGVDWIDGKLALIEYRSALAVVLTSDCQLEKICNFTDEDAFRDYFDNNITTKTRSINGCSYRIEYIADSCTSARTRLTMTNKSEETDVLYTYQYKRDHRPLLLLICSPIIVLCVIAGIIGRRWGDRSEKEYKTPKY